ncbi:hypothetical protein J5N97_014147 [Dioscorea zingiberensis]|uniref:Uncharacterized protein n=1 Tax=Dioscorea zingiberensis TaxID=325984 RepID=A0A9D5CSM9_9LILI|nr:hypothetical protein J5N97_014147 [Dioscorea zingiberensis]
MTTPVGCGGDGCDSREPWPLHHIRHRGVFCRLCTSCVLKYHPGSFCCGCFEVLDVSPPPEHPLVHCSKCPSASHVSCLRDPALAPQFVCPICDNPGGFSYFPVGSAGGEDGRRRVDLAAATVLLAAARVAAASMTRAAVAARVDAERKAREAALARKRAREMLERVFSLSKKVRLEKKVESGVAMVSGVLEAVEQKKKMPKPSEQRRGHSRDAEKWRRFQEPIPMVQRPVVGNGDSDKLKGSNVAASVPKNDTVDMKDMVGGLANPLHHQAKVEEKDTILGSQFVSIKEERGLMKDENVGTRIPQSTHRCACIKE